MYNSYEKLYAGLGGEDNDLFSRIYALKKLIPIDDTDNMKKDIKKLINKTPVDVCLLGILPSNWEEIYDKIVEF